MAILAATVVFAFPSLALAQPVLDIEMLTWHVVGLDSNNPLSQGPDEFLSGARVCNTGADPANGIIVDYVFDTANPYVDISPEGTDQLSAPFLLAGACEDFYFLLRVRRTPLAYNTTREFHIEVSADNHPTVSTPQPRELFVEHLISQNRNDVLSVVGPTEVYVGQIVQYTVNSTTATQGYEQLSSFLNFSNILFQVVTVGVSYSSPPAATNDRVYADACGWDDAPGPTPPSGTYRSCAGPIQYGAGKAGGDLETVYTIKFLAAGTTSVNELIYDFSGSSYHYNADVGISGINIASDPPLANIQFNKHCDLDPVEPGGTLSCIIEYGNNSLTETYTGVEINETYDPRTTFLSAVPAPDNPPANSHWTIGTLSPGEYGIITIELQVDAGANDGDILLNRATINDDVSAANDSPGDPPGAFKASETLTNVATDVAGSALLRVTKTGLPDPEVGAGSQIIYTVEYRNDGQATSYNTVLTDTLGTGLSFVSSVPAPTTSVAPVYTWNLGNLAPGASGSITVTVETDSALTTATIVENQVELVGQPGPGTSDTAGLRAYAEEIQFIRGGAEAIADVSITKTDQVGDDPVVQGGSLTYSLMVSNAGPDIATGVVVTDVLDPDTSFASSSLPCVEAPAGTLTCSIGDLAVGASTTITIGTLVSATAPSAGTLQVSPCNGTEDLCNNASVTSATTDPTPANNSADEPTNVTAVTNLCNLTVSKVDVTDPATPGGSLTYSIAVTNNGPDNAADVIIRDILDPNTTYVSDTFPSSCTEDPVGVVTCHYSNLPASQTRTRTITVNVSPTAPSAGSLQVGPCDGSEDLCNNIVATFGSNCKDTSPADNTASEPTNIPRPSSNLSITKTDVSSDPVEQGDTVTYTINVSNAGPAAADDVIVVDTLDANTTYVSDTASGGCVEAPAGTLTCSLGDLGVAGAASFDVTVLVDGAAPTAGITSSGLCTAPGVDICNTAVVSSYSTDPTPANNTATQPTNVTAVSADLSIVKSDGVQDPIREGDVLTYTIQVTNNGPNTANNVEVVDVLDANEFYLEDTASGGCVQAPPGTVTCSLGSLTNGQTVTFDMVVFAPTGTPTAGILQVDPCDGSEDLCNNATVSSSTTDPTPANNTDDEPTDVEPAEADLQITKSDVADPVAVGGSIVYAIRVSNPGPDDAQDVIVTDLLDADTTYVSDDFGCVEAPAGTLTCDLGALLAGQFQDINITVSVDAGAPTAGTLEVSPCTGAEDLCNNVSVAAGTVDPDPSNNTADEPSNVVVATADLSIDKSDAGSDPVVAGGSVTYTITVTNAGPDAADGVVVTDTLDGDTTYVSDTAGCVEAPAGTLTCSLGSLAVGSTSFDVTVDVDAGAPTAGSTQSGSCAAPGVDICNAVSVAAGTPDPVAGDNTAEEPTNVTAPSADVSVSKSDSGAGVAPGATFSYTVSVSNAGPQSATNVTVVDTLDSNTTFVSSTGACVEAPAGTLTCNRGSLAASASSSFTVTVQVAPGTPEAGTLENGTCNGSEDLCNSVVVSADQADPDPADNSDSEPTDVETPSGVLSIFKSDDPDTVQPSGSLTYTLTYSNPGNAQLDNVEILETYDPRTTFASAVPMPDFGDNRWIIGTLAPGEVGSITITTTVDAGLSDGDLLINTATMSADGEADTDVEEETTVAVPGAGRAQLGVDKSADPASIPAGGILTYTVTVRNTGTATAYDVVLSDVLPAGLDYRNAIPTPTLQLGQAVQWDVGDLPPGGSATYQIFSEVDAGLDSGTVFENTARAIGQPGPGTSDTSGLEAEGSATSSTSGPGTDCGIVMRKRHVGIVLAGNELVYRCLWCDPCVDAQGVVIVDQVPPELDIISVSSRDPFTIDHDTNQVRFEIGTLAAGRAGQAYITVRIPEGMDPGIVLENIISLTDAALREKTGTDVAVVGDSATTPNATHAASLAVTGTQRTTSGGTFNATLRYRNVGESSSITAVVTEGIEVTRAIPAPSGRSNSVMMWTGVGTSGVIKIRGRARIADAGARGAIASLDVSLADSDSGQVMVSGLDTAVLESTSPTGGPVSSPHALTLTLGGARYLTPGLGTQISLRYRNLAITSDAVVTLPSGLAFESAVPAPTTVSGNRIIWSGVGAGSGSFKIRALADPGLQPGTTVAVGTSLLTDSVGTISDEHEMTVR